MMQIILALILGIVAGTLGGFLGIGGGIILVPALVFIFKMSQHQAQGTTLALMVPPIGLLAAWTYYKHGFVDIKIAGIICIGFFVGGLIGAKYAAGIPCHILSKIFGFVLIIVGIRMVFFK